MKILIFLIAFQPMISLPASKRTKPSGIDSADYQEYKSRRAERRIYALQARRVISSSRGPAVRRTSVPVTIGPSIPRFNYSAIRSGWIKQPPIPVRTREVIVLFP